MAVAAAGAADVVVVKCTPLGGVRRSLAVAAAVATAAGLPCVVSSALETSVGLSAQLALAGALPHLELACGLGTVSLLAGDVVTEPLRPVGGLLPVPVRPPDPDPELLARYAHPDAARTRWWLDRLDRAHRSLIASGPDPTGV
jgi:O-succinylbenzoate synthase